MFKTFQQNVTTSGTPQQPPSTTVNSGLPVVIKAKKANTGNIGIGASNTAAALAGSQHFKLSANDSVEVRIANLNEIWLDADVNGEGVELLYEPFI